MLHLYALQNSAPFKTNKSGSAVVMGFLPCSVFKRTLRVYLIYFSPYNYLRFILNLIPVV
jgi:hypothetical protein